MHKSCLVNSSKQIEQWTLTVLAVAFPFDRGDSGMDAASGLCAINDGSSSPKVLDGSAEVI